MTLYYAMGGGLGHLTRARAVLHTLRVKEPVTLLTASPFADDPRVVGEAAVVRVPAGLEVDPFGYRAWLIETMGRLRPDAIYLDAFPAGLLGELCDFPFPSGVPIYHLARILRLPEYRRQLQGHGTMPRMARSYVLEPLSAEHAEWLRGLSDEVLPLTLSDPPAPSQTGQEPTSIDEERRPMWLVVHSGPAAEVAELLSYAAEQARMEGVDPRLVRIAPRPPFLAHAPGPEKDPHLISLDVYPAEPLFRRADRIITGCGFNTMRQAAPFALRHRYLPFPRRFDDQYLRAAQAASVQRAPC